MKEIYLTIYKMEYNTYTHNELLSLYEKTFGYSRTKKGTKKTVFNELKLFLSLAERADVYLKGTPSESPYQSEYEEYLKERYK